MINDHTFGINTATQVQLWSSRRRLHCHFWRRWNLRSTRIMSTALRARNRFQFGERFCFVLLLFCWWCGVCCCCWWGWGGPGTGTIFKTGSEYLQEKSNHMLFNQRKVTIIDASSLIKLCLKVYSQFTSWRVINCIIYIILQAILDLEVGNKIMACLLPRCVHVCKIGPLNDHL